jgi:hypothetical protein
MMLRCRWFESHPIIPALNGWQQLRFSVALLRGATDKFEGLIHHCQDFFWHTFFSASGMLFLLTKGFRRRLLTMAILSELLRPPVGAIRSLSCRDLQQNYLKFSQLTNRLSGGMDG